MKRDLDLIRTIMLKVEAEIVPALGPILAALGITGHSDSEILYHLDMLKMAGFIVGGSTNTIVVEIDKNPTSVAVLELTWQGHELLDDIRDPEIWRKTKNRAKGLASVGVGVLWEVAKAEIKAKLGLP